ncbi:hypothetical protein D3OALGA1CA_467 [Olavius algarvensis associated proteobacterium Delta 3]|nr:hypothetical protein D3OALGB2SA_471 [Olavius algarvensis associated proteobacterium Delta 3]CAB5084591.1 hypothetical protein D3OALGA1CA_467 [Olavius algarvensis associated proteobacterium Delta 3]
MDRNLPEQEHVKEETRDLTSFESDVQHSNKINIANFIKS